MEKFNYPTTIFYGEGALPHFVTTLKEKNHRRILIVSDQTLVKAGLVKKVTDRLDAGNIDYLLYDETHPNPVEADVTKGAALFRSAGCDSLIALGGGSPIDTAKVIKILATHSGPLAKFDDAAGGSRHIIYPMPPLYALPTTAGTGSEVGRSGVIIMKKRGVKTIFFHPALMPDIAVLEPELTLTLPPHMTAATGIDAFSHSLEAYLAPGFHPMADGIAREAMRLILTSLPLAFRDGKNREARSQMLMAAAMGATAFQKGLGMIHSLAHPLSASFNMHHGLAIALLIPSAVRFLEEAGLNDGQRKRMREVQSLFEEAGLAGTTLSESCRAFIQDLGIRPGLANHQIPEKDLPKLSRDAFEDGCHGTNMIPVTEADLRTVYEAAY